MVGASPFPCYYSKVSNFGDSEPNQDEHSRDVVVA